MTDCPPCPPLALLDDDELRSIAATASGLLLIEAARLYGFITGAPAIDEDRCDEVLSVARDRGVAPSQEDTNAAAIELIAQWNEAVESGRPTNPKGEHRAR